ncbi:MAG: hypothetical protein FJ279_34335 [Planctomycetes bacterium]|nr:hypothetical protein [Planctomycetota bacterium]MBM4078367.1 hypothetical protein [Planctomycetota bacterium]
MARTTWRIEIYLPKYYNPDTRGRRNSVEDEKFDRTQVELLSRFGAVTRTGKVPLRIISRLWRHRGVLHEDDIVTFIIYTRPAAQTRQFLRRYKRTLEERFRQLEVLIILTAVEIIR